MQQSSPPPYPQFPTPVPPSRGPGTGAIIGIIAGALVVVAVIVVGALYLKTIGTSQGSLEAPPSTEDSTSDDRPRVSDGIPAKEAVIDALTVGEADGTATTDCEYLELTAAQQAENPNLIDVGLPKGDGVPSSGSQTMTLTLNGEELRVGLDNEKSPCTAASFAFLGSQNFFDGSRCHRLTTEGIFVLQCGDPSGTGLGGPTYKFGDEHIPKDTAGAGPNYPAGTVAMTNASPDTNGSQFFICYEDTSLPPSFTIVGTVTSGLEVVTDIADQGAVLP